MSLNIDTNLHKTKKPKTIKLFDSPNTKLSGSTNSFNVINAEQIPMVNTALNRQS